MAFITFSGHRFIKEKTECTSKMTNENHRRSRKQKQKDKKIIMHVPTFCDWFSSSASACESDDPVLT